MSNIARLSCKSSNCYMIRPHLQSVCSYGGQRARADIHPDATRFRCRRHHPARSDRFLAALVWARLVENNTYSKKMIWILLEALSSNCLSNNTQKSCFNLLHVCVTRRQKLTLTGPAACRWRVRRSGPRRRHRRCPSGRCTSPLPVHWRDRHQQPDEYRTSRLPLDECIGFW